MGPAANQPQRVDPPQTAVPAAGDQKKTTDVAIGLNETAEAASPQQSFSLAEATAAWKQMLQQVQDMTTGYAAKAEAIATSGPNRLVARFRKAYNHAREFCERADRRQQLEQYLAELLGQPVRLEFETLPDEPQAAAVSAPRPQPTAARRRQRIRDVERNLLVQAAVTHFDAEIVDVTDPPEPEDTPATENASVPDP
jgi:predicted kinase